MSIRCRRIVSIISGVLFHRMTPPRATLTCLSWQNCDVERDLAMVSRSYRGSLSTRSETRPWTRGPGFFFVGTTQKQRGQRCPGFVATVCQKWGAKKRRRQVGKRVGAQEPMPQRAAKRHAGANRLRRHQGRWQWGRRRRLTMSNSFLA